MDIGSNAFSKKSKMCGVITVSFGRKNLQPIF